MSGKSSTKDGDTSKETGKMEGDKEIVTDTSSAGVKIVENNNEILECDKENKDVSKDMGQGKSTEDQGKKLKSFYAIFLTQLHNCR